MADGPPSGGRLAAYGGAYFFAAGAFMSYWPVWLRDRGVTDTEIGTLFMSRQIITVIATLSVGWIVHRLGGPRGVIVALGIGAVVMMVAYQFSYSFLAIFIVTMIWGFLWSPPMPLYDGVLVTETKKHRARLCARAHVEFGRLHLRHLPRRHRRRPLRAALGALCRHGEHRAAGAAGDAAAGHAAASRCRRARPRTVPRQRPVAPAGVPPVPAGLRPLPAPATRCSTASAP